MEKCTIFCSVQIGSPLIHSKNTRMENLKQKKNNFQMPLKQNKPTDQQKLLRKLREEL